MTDRYTVKTLRNGKFEVVPRATDRRSIYEAEADAWKRADFLNWADRHDRDAAILRANIAAQAPA